MSASNSVFASATKSRTAQAEPLMAFISASAVFSCMTGRLEYCWYMLKADSEGRLGEQVGGY